MASFELGKEIEKYVFSPPKDSKFFRCPTLVTIPKNIFLYFFTALKTLHLSYSICKNLQVYAYVLSLHNLVVKEMY